MLLQLATTKFCCVTTFEVGGTIRATTLFNFERNNVAWKLKKTVARITGPLVSSVFVFHLHFDARLARLFLYSNQETPHLIWSYRVRCCVSFIVVWQWYTHARRCVRGLGWNCSYGSQDIPQGLVRKGGDYLQPEILCVARGMVDTRITDFSLLHARVALRDRLIEHRCEFRHCCIPELLINIQTTAQQCPWHFTLDLVLA